MTIHFRDDVEHGNDATLRVIRGGMRGGAVVRVDLHAKGGYVQFSLTPKEVEMLRAELLPERVAMRPAECFVSDHVPGCEHQDPPLEGPPTDEEAWPDPLDDPHGAGTPAFEG